ncbi:MAG TPA: aminoacyl-tRNA hydrolase [Pyrinomonadaceae bacterium]|jgi:PTH1 family peptidyl-tRNA hydrolase
MRLIVGLGNPGAQYEWTRHNLGFMLVDRLARETGAQVKRRECRALVGRALIEGEQVELVKPQTYMNLSGESLACLLAKQERARERPDDLIVISDDLALPFGSIRLRPRGSSGGHNGLKSIIAATRTDEFARLRIGIRPEHPVQDAARFVLDEFTRAERAEVEKILDVCSEAVRAVVREGIEKAMSLYN